MTACRIITLPIPIGTERDHVKLRVPFIPTPAPGLVITPAPGITGEYRFAFGCVLTHAPSGRRVAGIFRDVGVARQVAGILGRIMRWDDRTSTDPRAVAVQAKHALAKCPELYAWLGRLNDWENN